jgi:hypothetical protein
MPVIVDRAAVHRLAPVDPAVRKRPGGLDTAQLEALKSAHRTRQAVS